MGRALIRNLWADTAPPAPARPALEGDVEAEVAVVGGGYTGLWTAYYLARAGVDVVVLEAETVGFGASGRNGGWCSALFPASLDALARRSSREAALAQHAAMRATVGEVRRVAEAEGIDAGIAHGGTLVLARTPVQLERARAEVADARTWGRGEDDLVLLPGEEARARLAATDVLGATYTPDCLAVHPLRLARGVAEAAARHGARIHEHSPVTSVAPGLARATSGSVRARTVVRATEGFTARLPGHARVLAPVYSLVTATEPLPPETWARIGLAQRETFSDHRHLIIYGQRTADDRFVLGGRGAPYHFRSRTDPTYDGDERVFAKLRATALELFPALAGAQFTHQWGGPLGVPRDWCASVGLDRGTGLAWAGGYVGDGVSTTNLAGRTLRDLVLGRDTDLTRLPWVGHRSPRWEPEPLRWLGINAGLRAMTWADREERLTRRPSVTARALAPLLGGH